MKFELSQDDVDRLISALDSHVYWQLSDQNYRNDGFVLDPGSDDAEHATEIAACEELASRLQAGK